MTETRKLRVFLSYAKEDYESVHEIYKRLKDEGWIEPWQDKSELLPGEHWTAAIKRAIDVADAVVIFLSENSINKEGFVHYEMNYAWDRSLQKPPGTIYRIPIRLDNCDIPEDLYELDSRQWVDYFDEKKDETYEKLLKALQRRREQKERFEAKEHARAEALAKRQAEERIRLEAEECARMEREDQERKEAEEKTRLEAEERARKEKKKQERKEVEDHTRRDADKYYKLLLAIESATGKIYTLEKAGRTSIDEVLAGLLPDLVEALDAGQAFVAVHQQKSRDRDKGFDLVAVHPKMELSEFSLPWSKTVDQVLTDGRPRLVEPFGDAPGKFIHGLEVFNATTAILVRMQIEGQPRIIGVCNRSSPEMGPFLATDRRTLEGVIELIAIGLRAGERRK